MRFTVGDARALPVRPASFDVARSERTLQWLTDPQAGVDELTTATHVWATWDPDHSPVRDGCFSMRSLADDLVATGQLDHADTGPFVATIHDAAGDGTFSMSVRMYAVIASAAR